MLSKIFAVLAVMATVFIEGEYKDAKELTAMIEEKVEQAQVAKGKYGTMPNVPSLSSVVSRMRPEHPRLFLNEDMWPAMKACALDE